MRDLMPDGKGRVRMEFLVPTRGLIGFRSLFLSLTSGSGLMTHVFDHYGDYKESELAKRKTVCLCLWSKARRWLMRSLICRTGVGFY